MYLSQSWVDKSSYVLLAINPNLQATTVSKSLKYFNKVRQEPKCGFEPQKIIITMGTKTFVSITSILIKVIDPTADLLIWSFKLCKLH